MFKNLIDFLDRLFHRYTPDPYLYAVLLTGLIFVLALILTPSSPLDLANYWGSGFWSLLNFTLQMVMILFLGSVCALSSPVKKILNYLAYVPPNLSIAAVFLSILSMFACSINWGFGLIFSALYCKELGVRFQGKKFRILVACAYSGFLVWHGGLSGSIPLVVATQGNFSEEFLGTIIPLSNTLLSQLNIILLLAHLIFTPLISYILIHFSSYDKSILDTSDQNNIYTSIKPTPAENLENSVFCTVIIIFLGFLFFAYQITNNKFVLDLNQINFLFFLLALILHKTPRKFLDSSKIAAKNIWPLIIQYPLYAGIMAIMTHSGLANYISKLFVGFASINTLAFWVYLSAGLVNIFVPSGGGQWAVQAPMVISAARELGTSLESIILAVAWGDAWTNMIQPFWALPLLAIAGLKARDIMGVLVIMLVCSGIVSSFCFLMF